MAGGVFSSQNKKQPGIYINVVSDKNYPVSIGDRGIVTICKALSWGVEGKITEILASEDYSAKIGHDNISAEAMFLREIFMGTDHTLPAYKVLLYRPELVGAAAATGSMGNLTVKARYKGKRGNDIKIAIVSTGSDSFLVQTYVGTVKKDEQEAAQIKALTANEWVTFDGTGAIEAIVSLNLTGGVDGEMTAADYASYLAKIEPYSFDILIYDGKDETIKMAVESFVNRLRSTTGRRCQAVVSDYKADTEAVISVLNGYSLPDGTIIPPEQATWWLGGAEAGAKYNESLVYAIHPNAVDSVPKMTGAAIDAALDQGQIVFMEEFGKVKVVSDINTLVTHTEEKDDYFSLNQVVRIMDTFCNAMYKEFSTNYIGRVQNNGAGRDLLKSWTVGYLNEMQANGGIQNFVSEDVTISEGSAINAVVIAVAIQPVGAIEKIYVTVKLTDKE